MDRNKIVIFGDSHQAELAWHTITHNGPDEVVAFTVDGQYLTKTAFHGIPVVPFEELPKTYSPHDFELLVALGFQRKSGRQLTAAKIQQGKELGYTLYTYIHPRAVIAKDVAIGENCIIYAGVVIEPFASIQDGVTVRTQAYIGHHNEIGYCSFIASRIATAGHVTVEPYCFIGVNATLRDNVTIGQGSIIGCGVTVLKDVTPGSVIKAPEPTLIPVRPESIQV